MGKKSRLKRVRRYVRAVNAHELAVEAKKREPPPRPNFEPSMRDLALTRRVLAER